MAHVAARRTRGHHAEAVQPKGQILLCEAPQVLTFTDRKQDGAGEQRGVWREQSFSLGRQHVPQMLECAEGHGTIPLNAAEVEKVV